ncbi:SRPBCC family protein [Polynucleobacter sp. MWH-Aus1W21]|jgi:hypothetical protein|uniref:SRPBCC family protein n=1 Tax=Polynucleobacter sp. MWH-Aus1W21 TaxID=1855880 RepID=UPI001BFEB7E9|nr:SRPBCC family protein [Polynucleobacter sp. MWH-Aus1W21]QWD66233.1 cyclase/dehydrase [Polynucleobacter sp. MWH-Aus1W21]
MKWLLFLTLATPAFGGYAQENLNPYDVQVNTRVIDSRIQIDASYTVPINICSAFAFLTAYESAKTIPGILESKVISRVGNKVRVYRVIEEQILFFPIELKSTIEYTEASNRLVTFEQISGDTKLYRGSWRLTPDKNSTTFKYDALVEPHSLIPSTVTEYFMKNGLRDRFELMAQKARETRASAAIGCK